MGLCLSARSEKNKRVWVVVEVKPEARSSMGYSSPRTKKNLFPNEIIRRGFPNRIEDQIDLISKRKRADIKLLL
jgi:hypothetical protein